MRRKLLPILSIACLAIAGMLAMGYSRQISVLYGHSPASGGPDVDRITGLSLNHGIVLYYNYQYVGGAVSKPPGWNIQIEKPNAKAPLMNAADMLSDFAAERTVYPGSTHSYVVFPLWCPILILLTPSLFWWRQRRRDRANAPGFPVESIQPAP